MASLKTKIAIIGAENVGCTNVRIENSRLPVSTLINDYHGISDVGLCISPSVNKIGIKYYPKLDLSLPAQEQL